ncbi:MAG: prepilin-type N-terminal cleavage/methylation domain-containing protein [Actinobacteria bacterium]|nr:prepilin-type N-terminal cleavage/methylation domain-containing protein [Actinomycetota bacterium]
MNHGLQKNKGFTLIELLITLTIIAVLSAIGLVAFSYVLKQGRDSKRQSDLRAIQSALEQYYSDQGSYPTASITSGVNGLDTVLGQSTPAPFTSNIGRPLPSPKPL